MKHIRIRRLIKSVISMWNNLDRSIYVGDRLISHMTALTLVSIFTAILGLILIIFDVVSHQPAMIFASVTTFVAGVVCALCASVLNKIKIAEIIPTLFCAIAFTIYAFTGAAHGTAILWSLLLPIGICYFVNVKYGIILSAYYSVLFAIVF